jgi:hypothetical protein
MIEKPTPHYISRDSFGAISVSSIDKTVLIDDYYYNN